MKAAARRCRLEYALYQDNKGEKGNVGYDTANYDGDLYRPLRLAVRACTRAFLTLTKARTFVPRFFCF